MLVGSLLSGGHGNRSNWSSFSIVEYGRRAELANSIIAQYVAHTEIVALSYSGFWNSSGILVTGSLTSSSPLVCESVWSELICSVCVSSPSESAPLQISLNSCSSAGSSSYPEVLASKEASELHKNLSMKYSCIYGSQQSKTHSSSCTGKSCPDLLASKEDVELDKVA